MVQHLTICLPMQETQIRALGREDALEEEMAIHCSILTWKIPRTEEPGGAAVHGGRKELDTRQSD